MNTHTHPPEAERGPAEPITYGRRVRWTDYRAGRRDGLRRIPSLAEVAVLLRSGGSGHQPTPYLQMLVNRAHDMVEHERLRFVAATTAVRTQQAELEHRLAAPRSAIQAAEANLIASRADLTDADMVARHAHEAHHSEALLRHRRENQRRHRIAAAEIAYQRCLADQVALHDELARVNEMIESQLAVARLHAVRIFAYTTARIATYWEGLVLAHRDGAHLAALLPHLSPRLPDWVMAPADADPTGADQLDLDDHPHNDDGRLAHEMPDAHEFPERATPMPVPPHRAHTIPGVTPSPADRELSPRGGRR